MHPLHLLLQRPWLKYPLAPWGVCSWDPVSPSVLCSEKHTHHTGVTDSRLVAVDLSTLAALVGKLEPHTQDTFRAHSIFFFLSQGLVNDALSQPFHFFKRRRWVLAVGQTQGVVVSPWVASRMFWSVTVTCGKWHELSLKASVSSVSICPSLLAFPHFQHCSFGEWVTAEV